MESKIISEEENQKESKERSDKNILYEEQYMEKLNQMEVPDKKIEETKPAEKEVDGNQMKHQEPNTGNTGKRKEVEMKGTRFINHPNTENDKSGHVNEVIRSWYKEKKDKEDQRITDNHKVKKLRQK